MTKISKILAVFVAAASIAFMAFAGAVSVSGPNWETEAAAEDLSDYSFEKVDGEKPTYSVSYLHGPGGEPESVKSGTPVLAEAVIAARAHKLKLQNDRMQAIEATIQPLTNRINDTRTLLKVDHAALQKYDAALTNRLQVLQNNAETLSKQFEQTSLKARELREESAARREDVTRLTNQLELIRAEIYHIEHQQVLLRDALYRIEGKLDIASRTNTKLKGMLGKPPYEEEATDASDAAQDASP